MYEFAHWEKIDNTGLSPEKIESLIEACRLAHYDFFSIGLVCGIRAAFRVLGEMGADRLKHDVDFVEIKANTSVGLAFFVITCLSPLKDNNMKFELYSGPDWTVTAYGADKKIEIKMLDRSFNGPMEVFTVPDDELFASVEIKPL